ncbi:hypothetical protein Vadar_003198 [Vaccinium darrowii]|uniref:Uncharacterized protein n=1 Tax=Vaccinium darrowii TaxID=229202 RepID=A0ACB7YSR8_9ERIC|nr:hypothetical protein Vadar_003198 [Vaccinium darrowii]
MRKNEKMLRGNGKLTSSLHTPSPLLFHYLFHSEITTQASGVTEFKKPNDSETPLLVSKISYKPIGLSSVALSSESSSSSFDSTSSKKGKRSQFEKKLDEFFKHQIESGTSTAYREGFREGNQAVLKYGLKRTLDHIRLTERFPKLRNDQLGHCYLK